MKRYMLWILLAGVAMLPACHQPESAPAQRAQGGDAERGARLIRVYGCGTCHTIPGIRGARGLTGPPLTDFAQRSYIAGRITNNAANLIAWIVNPQAVDSMTAMPVVGVTAADANHIAAYLYTLERGGLGPGYLLQWR